VLFEGIDISGFSKSKNTAKNTDGWWDFFRQCDFQVGNVEADWMLVGIYTAQRILSFRTRLLTMEMVWHRRRFAELWQSTEKLITSRLRFFQA
jgi:hypothetical protein